MRATFPGFALLSAHVVKMDRIATAMKSSPYKNWGTNELKFSARNVDRYGIKDKTHIVAPISHMILPSILWTRAKRLLLKFQ